MSFELSRNFQQVYIPGLFDPGSQTSVTLDSAFVFETSGDAAMLYFISPVTQASGALTIDFYVDGIVGSPELQVEVRNGPGLSDDSDRPESGGSTIGTPGSSVSPTVVDRWYSLTLTGLSLTVGSAYFIITKNIAGTPASNSADVVYRAQLDGSPINQAATELIRAGFTANGFTSDPSLGAAISPLLLTFDSGDFLGLSFVEAMSVSSNDDWRGNRVIFDTDVECSGMKFNGSASALGAASFSIYQGSTEIATVSGNRTTSQEIRLVRWEPVTLTAGIAYDFVFQPTSSTSVGTAYSMGQGTLPTAVTESKYRGITRIGGPTPGSFTETIDEIFVVSPFIDKYIAGGGGGGGLIIHPGMTGGING